VNQEELSSQLSAMFDGELPAAECELLSRRLARDEQLRATWSRYAVIGAALRAEPVASVHADFARRVSTAIEGGSSRRLRGLAGLRGAAVGGAVAAGVAAMAIFVMRTGLGGGAAQVAAVPQPAQVQVAAAVRPAPAAMLPSSREPESYVVPPLGAQANAALNASVADYVIAHSEVAPALARQGLLSSLVGGEVVTPALPRNLRATGPRRMPREEQILVEGDPGQSVAH
jgi:anti-sigma factor RsiW